MEPKMKSEKSGSDNLELVIESISEDLKSNIELNSNLISEIKNLSGIVSELLENQKSQLSKNETDIIAFKKEFKEIRTDLNGISFPETRLNELSEKLTANSFLLKYPAEATVLHHHHVPKLTWVTVGLWLAFSLSLSGLVVVNNKLNGYIENDIKYRHLKLDTGNISLQVILDREDSVYNSNPDFKNIVLKTEQKYLQNLERLQKADRLKKEAKDLEKQARGK